LQHLISNLRVFTLEGDRLNDWHPATRSQRQKKAALPKRKSRL
jgi:hypothetical protein